MDGSIWREIITVEMGSLAAAVIAIMLFLGRIPVQGGRGRLNELWWWHSWGIFIMFALAIGGAFMPGIHDIPYSDWGGILVFGLVTSMVALLGRAILKPIILRRLEGKQPPKE